MDYHAFNKTPVSPLGRHRRSIRRAACVIVAPLLVLLAGAVAFSSGYVSEGSENLAARYSMAAASPSTRSVSPHIRRPVITTLRSNRKILNVYAGLDTEALSKAANEACKPQDVQRKVQEEGFKILDVRPKSEVDLIRPKGSLHVEFAPVIENGRQKSIMAENQDFLKTLRKKNLKKSQKLIVSCGDGPLSLIACKQLHDAGYKNAEWLAGGLASVPEGLLENDGDRISVGYGSDLKKGLDITKDFIQRIGARTIEEAQKIDYEALKDQSQSTLEKLKEEGIKVGNKAKEINDQIDYDKLLQDTEELAKKAKSELDKIDYDKFKKDTEDLGKKAGERAKKIRKGLRDWL